MGMPREAGSCLLLKVVHRKGWAPYLQKARSLLSKTWKKAVSHS